MKFKNRIKGNISQIFAIAEKNVRLATRHKIPLFLRFFRPILGIIMPIIIMGEILTFTDSFGPWDSGNYIVYLFTSYQLLIIYQIVGEFTAKVAQDKSTNSFALLILAPFRNINLLFGIIVSHFILSAVPLMMFFIWCYILFPISIITIFSIFFIYFIITLFFCGIALVLSIFIISKPILSPLLAIPLELLMMFSCLTMPFEFFPENIQSIANLNPYYYIFVITRYVWIEDNIILSITSHPFTFLVVIICAILSLLIGLRFFNYMFNKYRIQVY